MTQTRENNSNWKGGRLVASNGYVLIRVGEGHHLADVRGYAYEHRLVAEQSLGRKLLPGERVRHRNGDKTDNVAGNIFIADVKQGETACGCGCGEVFPTFDSSGRPRKFVSGHNGKLDAKPEMATCPKCGGAKSRNVAQCMGCRRVSRDELRTHRGVTYSNLIDYTRAVWSGDVRAPHGKAQEYGVTFETEHAPQHFARLGVTKQVRLSEIGAGAPFDFVADFRGRRVAIDVTCLWQKRVGFKVRLATAMGLDLYLLMISPANTAAAVLIRVPPAAATLRVPVEVIREISKGGDPAEWPEDLNVREMPA